MGANFDYRVYRRKGFEDAKSAFEDAQDYDRYENGHSYSGGIGMATGVTEVTGHVFESENAAYDYVVENANKWGDALAVEFLDSDGERSNWFIGASCAS